MIKEAYVSYEIAKLLKEKGFDEYCDNYYHQSSDEPQQLTLDEMYYSYDEFIKAPTQQIAMKWLRGKGIECVVIPIWNTISKQYRSYVLSDLGDKYKDNYDSYSNNISYEDAVEAAIKYALENLMEEQL